MNYSEIFFTELSVCVNIKRVCRLGSEKLFLAKRNRLSDKLFRILRQQSDITRWYLLVFSDEKITILFFSLSGINATAFSNLCALCAGTGADKCSTDSAKNKYVSHVGAFKCMAEGKGDVAFLKHTKLQDAVESGNYGNLTDYELLCKDGTRKGNTVICLCSVLVLMLMKYVFLRSSSCICLHLFPP